MALWMESDRMSYLLGAVTQDALDEQRGVVQNEKRQGENQPYGRVFNQIIENLFPSDHPYSWLPIGSMEDLDAASLEDVHEWFRTYYGPNNAVIVIAGDIDPEEAFAKAEKFFGDIPPGPPLTRPDVWIPRHDKDRRMRMEDRVPQSRVYLAWTGPAWGTRDANHMALVTEILGSGNMVNVDGFDAGWARIDMHNYRIDDNGSGNPGFPDGVINDDDTLRNRG